MRSIHSSFLLMILFFISSLVCAENLTASESPMEQLLVQGYRQDLLGTSISAAEGVVGSVEIENRPVLRTGEILEFVPGMVVTQHSGSGKANQYFLRGFNLDHGTDFATSVDAMPINMRSHGHGQGYTDLNFIIPELIHDIRYLKGPYYTEVGDFSGAGAAEFSLKNVLAANELSVGFGENDYQRLYSAQQFDFQQSQLLWGVELQAYAGPWQDIDEDVKKTNVLARYSAPIADGDFSLTFMAYDNHWNAADQIPLRAVEQGLISALGSLDMDVGGEASRYSLSSQWQHPEWSLSAYMIGSNLHLFSNFTYFLDDALNGDEFEQVDKRQIFGGEIVRKLQNDFVGKTVAHKLGVQWRYDNINELGLYKTRAREHLSTIRIDEVDEASISLFFQSEMELSEEVRAHVGVRYDYLAADVNSHITANSGDAADALTNLKAGLSYNINSHLETYVNFGQGFHSNDARGATIAIDPVSGETAMPVDLLSRSQGAEVGVKLFNNDRYSLSTSMWYLQLDSELVFVGDAGNTEASRASARSGIEIASYFWFAEGWSIDTELAWTRSRFTENESAEGKYVDGSLPFVASAGITYAPSSKGWQSSLRYRHFGARVLDSFAQKEASATSLVNFGTHYSWERMTLGLDILNLLDSDDHDIDYFYPSRLLGEPEEGVEDVHFHPVEPRTLRVQWEIFF